MRACLRFIASVADELRKTIDKQQTQQRNETASGSPTNTPAVVIPTSFITQQLAASKHAFEQCRNNRNQNSTTQNATASRSAQAQGDVEMNSPDDQQEEEQRDNHQQHDDNNSDDPTDRDQSKSATASASAPSRKRKESPAIPNTADQAKRKTNQQTAVPAAKSSRTNNSRSVSHHRDSSAANQPAQAPTSPVNQAHRSRLRTNVRSNSKAKRYTEPESPEPSSATSQSEDSFFDNEPNQKGNIKASQRRPPIQVHTLSDSESETPRSASPNGSIAPQIAVKPKLTGVTGRKLHISHKEAESLHELATCLGGSNFVCNPCVDTRNELIAEASQLRDAGEEAAAAQVTSRIVAPKTYRSRKDVNVHICTAHTGEKPYACPATNCEHRTADPANLRRHVNQHFHCNKCDQDLFGATQRKNHICI